MSQNDLNKIKTLKAINVNDTLNEKKNNEFETFEKDGITYFVVDSTKTDLPRVDDYLKRVSVNFASEVSVDVQSFVDLSDSDTDAADVIRTVIVACRFNQKIPFNMKSKTDEAKKISFVLNEKYKSVYDEAMVISDAQFFCRKLQDTPSGMLDPEKFVEKYLELFSQVADLVKIKILDKKELQEKNMNLLLGVNLGSAKEPRLMCVEYKNNPDSDEFYGYVGKGITFDSGGMNIKTMSYMRWMKFDMSGAAIVMATVYALAKNKIKTNVVAVAALTENLVSPKALRPDDILVSHSGKTVEIDNTDAEGRLVLADALSYTVKEYNVTKLVDVATLTGAMAFSLGDTYTGVWSTCNKDWKRFKKAAKKAGEYVWRLPFHENYRDLLKSRIADIANECGDRRAGSCRAANFLVEFTHGVNYIHLDVAMTATSKNAGQGIMIKTLYEFSKF